jgi:hypothetical protein
MQNGTQTRSDAFWQQMHPSAAVIKLPAYLPGSAFFEPLGTLVMWVTLHFIASSYSNDTLWPNPTTS